MDYNYIALYLRRSGTPKRFTLACHSPIHTPMWADATLAAAPIDSNAKLSVWPMDKMMAERGAGF